MNSTHCFAMVLVMAGVTYLIRAFPFLVFGGGKQPPSLVEYLGRVVSPAAIAMLIVYCFRNVSFYRIPFGWQELAASAVVIGLQLWRRNPLLSILAGTILYMVLGHL